MLLSPSPIEIAYAAGLFEGEGYVQSGYHTGWMVVIAMTDREPLERMMTTIGGYINGPYGPYGHGLKAHWRWVVRRHADVIAFFEMVRPYLSPRRTQQFETALSFQPKPIGRPRKAA